MDPKAIKAMLILPVLTMALTLTAIAQSRNPFAKRPQPEIFGGAVPQAGFSGSVIPQGVDVYLLGPDNTIYPFRTCDDRPIKVRLFTPGERLIGIDFRPADGLLYAISNLSVIYTIDVTAPGRGNVIKISTLNPRFASGFQSLADFNPVVNALRLIGSDRLNYAVVNNGGNLNLTAPQARITYAAGDPNASFDPKITGGSYNNNVNGATITLFYALDYDRHTVAMPPVGANGSSATGTGVFRTVANLKTRDGQPFVLSPLADMDIYTDATGMNYVVGVSGDTLFTFDLNQIDPNQAVGDVRDVIVQTQPIRDLAFLDIGLVTAPPDCRGNNRR